MAARWARVWRAFVSSWPEWAMALLCRELCNASKIVQALMERPKFPAIEAFSCKFRSRAVAFLRLSWVKWLAIRKSSTQQSDPPFECQYEGSTGGHLRALQWHPRISCVSPRFCMCVFWASACEEAFEKAVVAFTEVPSNEFARNLTYI